MKEWRKKDSKKDEGKQLSLQERKKLKMRLFQCATFLQCYGHRNSETPSRVVYNLANSYVLLFLEAGALIEEGRVDTNMKL